MSSERLRSLIRKIEAEKGRPIRTEKMSLNTPVFVAERCRDHQKLSFIINELSRTPRSIFETLQIPVDLIKVETDNGKGYERKFIFDGVAYSRPELAAKKYYENIGHIVSWSEGEAFGILLDSIAMELSYRIRGLFKISEKNILTEADLQKEISALEELMGSLDNSGVSLRRNIEIRIANAKTRRSNQLKLLEEFDKGGGALASALQPFIVSLVSDDFAEIEYNIKRITKYEKIIKLNRNIRQLKSAFDAILREVVYGASTCRLEYWMPYFSAEHVPDVRRSNFNNHAKDFAIKCIKDLPRQAIYQYILDARKFSCPNFDLTIFDVNKCRYYFREVKYKDRMTFSQIQDIELFYGTEIDIGLAVISDN